jgi:hypothetical protein
MCDVYIYNFVTSNGQDRDNVLSSQPATLEAIKDRGGEPVMESQIVVDHTQLDGDCFLVAADGSNSHELNDLAAQIWSLEVRAASRDNEAIASVDGVEKYMLSLESRELRKQARLLKSQRTLLMARESGFRTDARDLIHFGAGVAT